MTPFHPPTPCAYGRARRIGSLALVLPLLACVEPEADGTCSTVLSPDAWVDGGSEPRFVESWRAGGTREGEELATPVSAAASRDGALAIVDFRLGVIAVGPDGSWRGVATPPGEGPGEAEGPAALTWTDAGHLAVLDAAGAVVVVDAEGRLVRETPVDPTALARLVAGGRVAGVALAAETEALVQKNEPDPGSTELHQVLIRLPLDGGPVDTLARGLTTGLGGDWPPARSMAAPGFPRLVFAAAPDGRVAVAGHDDGYEVTVIHPDGARTTVCRDDVGHPLRADEVGDPGSDEPLAEVLAPTLEATPDPGRPFPIGRLLFGRDGRLWVERARPAVSDPLERFTGREGSTFDVFDSSGGYLGPLAAPDGARILAAAGDRVWTLELGDYDEIWLVAYRLSAPG